MEQRDNAGALFKNANRANENHPNYKGEAVIAGVPTWVSGWVKVASSGVKYMSLAFTPKEVPVDASEPDGDLQRKGQEEMPF